MRHARDPSPKLCHACGKRFVGYDPYHCPACGGFGWGPSNDRIPADELELAEHLADRAVLWEPKDWEWAFAAVVGLFVDRDAAIRERRRDAAIRSRRLSRADALRRRR